MVNTTADIRFKRTLRFLDSNLTGWEREQRVLDLGVDNYLATLMRLRLGLKVDNTPEGLDLDSDFEFASHYGVFTAFEIFEHLLAPYNFLNANMGVLYASVPLNVWFSSSYWNNNDTLDRHYHEFEPRQFRHVLHRTGWGIVDEQIWRTPDRLRLGVRPLLRFVFPSYMIVKAIKR